MSNRTISIYEVGGCVRDELLGQRVKDIDFTVIAPSFEAMREYLVVDAGFTIHTENPEFYTVRCGIPSHHPLRNRAKDADFVWARIDGPSSDGRRPDWVNPGTLHDDLARRDFTVNAMARNKAGHLIDPFYGQRDLKDGVLRFVGEPLDRIQEDGLRVMRGFRFMVTKELTPTTSTWEALTSREAARMLRGVSRERVMDELNRMFEFDTKHALHLIGKLSNLHIQAIFRGALRLSATMKG